MGTLQSGGAFIAYLLSLLGLQMDRLGRLLVETDWPIRRLPRTSFHRLRQLLMGVIATVSNMAIHLEAIRGEKLIWIIWALS